MPFLIVAAAAGGAGFWAGSGVSKTAKVVAVGVGAAVCWRLLKK